MNTAGREGEVCVWGGGTKVASKQEEGSLCRLGYSVAAAHLPSLRFHSSLCTMSPETSKLGLKGDGGGSGCVGVRAGGRVEGD